MIDKKSQRTFHIVSGVLVICMWIGVVLVWENINNTNSIKMIISIFAGLSALILVYSNIKLRFLK